jgi:integrase/recombinase XerD
MTRSTQTNPYQGQPQAADFKSAETVDRKIAEVNSTAQLVALWLHQMRPQTSRTYEYDIRCLIGFLVGKSPQQTQLNDAELQSLTLNDLYAFADYLETQGLAASTRKRRLAAVKSLLSFGQFCGYLDVNLGARYKLPKVKNTLARRILSEMEVMTMIALTPPGRARLVIQFFYYTGARVGEVEGLTWRDIGPGRDGQGIVTLFGKGGTTRTVIIPEKLYQDLLDSRVGKHPKEPVFVSRKGQKPLRARQLRKIVADAAKRAGIAEAVSPHWLRHSHGTHSLERGAPPQLTQRTLGHASLETTSKYLHARPSDSSGLYLPN